MIVFELTMPGRGSWNGRWSGEAERHVLIRYNDAVPKDLIGNSYTYRWDDGWTACVTVSRATAAEARKLMRLSSGFCGYGWMVDSLIRCGEIKAPYRKPEVLPADPAKECGMNRRI